MTVIKINAITVPEGSGGELARRFAERAGAVDGQTGFEGFELLEPTDGRSTWLVVTRWADEASFNAWVRSPSFADGHRGVTGSAGGGHAGAGHAGGGHGGAGHGGAGHGGAGHGGAGHGGATGERPLSVSAELWSYRIATGAAPRTG